MRIVKTTTKDWLKFTWFLSTPEVQSDTIVVHIHGMAGSPYENDWYIDFHEFYPKKWCAFLVWQLRWTWEMTMFETVSWEYKTYWDAFEIFEESLYDVSAWVDYARNLGYKNIILQAHSFWPSKALYYLHKQPSDDIITVVLISPVDMLWLTLIDPNYSEMDAESKMYIHWGQPHQTLHHLLDGDTYLSAGTFQNLFWEDSRANIFCYTNRSHDWWVVRSIQTPVLLIGWTKDSPMEKVLSTAKCFEILKQEFQNSPRITSKVYEWADHSFSGFWERIVSEVIEFMHVAS